MQPIAVNKQKTWLYVLCVRERGFIFLLLFVIDF